jgi:hypothetical protein
VAPQLARAAGALTRARTSNSTAAALAGLSGLPLVGDAGPVIGDRYSALVDENADDGVGGFHLIALSVTLLM